MTEFDLAKNLHDAQTALNLAMTDLHEAGLLLRVFVISGQHERVVVEIMRPFEATRIVTDGGRQTI